MVELIKGGRWEERDNITDSRPPPSFSSFRLPPHQMVEEPQHERVRIWLPHELMGRHLRQSFDL